MEKRLAFIQLRFCLCVGSNAVGLVATISLEKYPILFIVGNNFRNCKFLLMF